MSAKSALGVKGSSAHVTGPFLRDREYTQHVCSSSGVKESNSTYLESIVDDDG